MFLFVFHMICIYFFLKNFDLNDAIIIIFSSLLNPQIQNRFPLNELVNVIAQAAINGDIPFNKVDLNKPFKMQQLQIPILLLRPEDIYKASSSNNINFKLITAQPIRIPIYGENFFAFKFFKFFQ